MIVTGIFDSSVVKCEVIGEGDELLANVVCLAGANIGEMASDECYTGVYPSVRALTIGNYSTLMEQEEFGRSRRRRGRGSLRMVHGKDRDSQPYRSRLTDAHHAVAESRLAGRSNSLSSGLSASMYGVQYQVDGVMYAAGKRNHGGVPEMLCIVYPVNLVLGGWGVRA
jgi:hypothetical protein